jgi:hypothetical protein
MHQKLAEQGAGDLNGVPVEELRRKCLQPHRG